MRGYYSMALTSLTGAYFRLNMDVSPESTSNWKDGPVEATIGFSVGFMLETKKAQKKENMEKSEYFPDYEEMRKKQDKMAEEIGE